MLQNLSTPFPGQPGLLQAELAHLHIVNAGHQEDRRLLRVQLHLPGHIVAVKVGIPPAALVGVLGRIVGRPDERNAEVTVHRGCGCDLLLDGGTWGRLGR
jgi:hypothetical protein